MMLPVAQRGGVAVVHVDAVEQRLRALCAQPFIQRAAEAAELRVFAVAQRQHGVAQARKLRRRAGGGRLHQAGEGGGGVGRIAFAVGAGHEQHAFVAAQPRQVELAQRRDAHVQAAGAQRVCGLAGQRLGAAGLAGVRDEHGGARRRLVQRLAGPRFARALAARAAPGPGA